MSKRLITLLQPATQCQLTYARKCAPRAYLFRNDDHSRPRRSRPFSSTPRQCAGSVRQIKPSMMSQPSQPSISVQRDRMMQQAMRTGELPNDVGILPDTFVMPPRKKRPSWFKNFEKRWKLEKARLGVRWADLYQILTFRLFSLKPRPKLHLSSLPDTAKELHKEMFANFATGDLSSINNKICDGLLSSLRRRISQRPPNTSYIWKLHKYLSPPKLVSYKTMVFTETMQFPATDRHGMVQAVIRIHSLQSLQPVKRRSVKQSGRTVVKEFMQFEGIDVPVESMVENISTKDAKETVEYVVIQQMYKRAEPQEWRVWGMAEEMSVAKLEKNEEKRLKGRAEAEVEKERAGAGA